MLVSLTFCVLTLTLVYLAGLEMGRRNLLAELDGMSGGFAHPCRVTSLLEQRCVSCGYLLGRLEGHPVYPVSCTSVTCGANHVVNWERSLAKLQIKKVSS